jgi:1-acyl-sn-glycerol-3-phosphate acyltransferase
LLLYSPVRPFARWLISRRLRVRLHGADLVPATGPVIFACNHLGVIDGPLLAIFSPRRVHALTKEEMFDGRLGGFLRASGQIKIDRFRPDPLGVKTCVRVLREGQTVGIFPEGRRGTGDFDRFHRGAAYLALVTGAPVIPVIFLGSREPGASSGSVPPRASEIDIVYGAPYTFPAAPWPRTREQVAEASLLLRQHALVHLDAARKTTGRELPGPLPAADVETDPATGVTDQGAP